MNAVETGVAWQRHCRIVALRYQAEQTFLELGEELYWFEEERQYKVLGHSSFNAYLADPEVDISRAMAYRLKGVYEKYVLKLGISEPDGIAARLLPVGADKLDAIRPYVDEGNVDEWLDKAATLSRSDLRQEVKKTFNPPPPAPPGAPEGEVQGNTVMVWCHSQHQVSAVTAALAGLVEWR